MGDCNRKTGWSCDQPCGPDNIYNDKCSGQPLYQAPMDGFLTDGG